jgi:ferric-dicitrate binding protein FerR (iron transport regulator)
MMESSAENDRHDLIVKFLAGESDEKDLKQLKEWLEQDPANRRIFDKEADLWQETNAGTRLEFFREDEGWEILSRKIGADRKNSKKTILLRKNTYRLLAAAASLAVLIALSATGLWLNGKKQLAGYGAATTVIETREGERASLILSDSTRVILNSGTTINYASDFNIDSRKISLSGEAYFDVATNPEKPFEVQLDKLKISAKGTKFNVFSFLNEDRIEATLEEGNIAIAVGEKAPLELSAGQQAVYFRKTGKILVRDVATETYTSWKEHKLRFKDTPLEEVLRRIGRKYNVRFELASTDLLDLKYTGTFIDESIEDVMQMMSAVSPVTCRITYMTSVNDKQYTKPVISIGWAKRKKI